VTETLGKPFKAVPFRVVVQVALLPDQVEAIPEFAAKEVEVFRSLMEMVRSGCAVTFRPNEKGGYAASIQAVHPSHRAAGEMIFGNAPSPEESGVVLLYKLANVGPKLDWQQKAETNGGKGYS